MGSAMVGESTRVEGKAPFNWVVDMEKRTEGSVEKLRWKKTSIYRVPEWLKELTNAKAYRPLLVSLGPFHHGEADLLPMEEHKRRAVLHVVKRSGRPLAEFVTAIEEVADELLDTYQGLDDKWRGENRSFFVEMMVTDGCFLLEVIRADELPLEDVEDSPNDPVFSKHGLSCLWCEIKMDMLAIENQLPLLALERLLTVQQGWPSSYQRINNMVNYILDCQCDPEMDDLGLHPLDIYHNSLCGGGKQDQESDEVSITIPTAMELSEAGIRFKVSTTSRVHDVGFENGVLSLPLVRVDDCTEKIFLNLVAFEQLHRDAEKVMIDYLYFMDHIIDTEKDVALLRSKVIIKSLCSSDKEVAVVFNNVVKGVTYYSTKKVHDVKHKVNAHCAKRWNKWRAFFVQAYLSNPWVFISLVAAIILLMATLLQTVYTVIPFYTKN